MSLSKIYPEITFITLHSTAAQERICKEGFHFMRHVHAIFIQEAFLRQGNGQIKLCQSVLLSLHSLSKHLCMIQAVTGEM